MHQENPQAEQAEGLLSVQETFPHAGEDLPWRRSVAKPGQVFFLLSQIPGCGSREVGSACSM